MEFEKYHALGNDYLVFDPKGKEISFSEKKLLESVIVILASAQTYSLRSNRFRQANSN
jgi:diaminopimelate epimerase